MFSSPLPLRLFCRLLIGCCVLLQACATADKSEPSLKIGMHIDAVLEFVMEYPQAWSKDRRLASGGREGELRWTHPDQPMTLLRVKSSLLQQPAVGMEQLIDQVLSEYAGLNVLSRDKVTLAGGEAWHITGQSAQVNLEFYLLSSTRRSYLITLTSSPADTDRDREIMERVARSFQVLP